LEIQQRTKLRKHNPHLKLHTKTACASHPHHKPYVRRKKRSLTRATGANQRARATRVGACTPSTQCFNERRFHAPDLQVPDSRGGLKMRIASRQRLIRRLDGIYRGC
jgi:hypothetical protein